MSEPTESHQDLYRAVGELILMASALDHQLTRICIAVFGLAETAFLEPVVASLDSSRKVDMLKAYTQKLKPSDWKTGIKKHVEAVELINRKRNEAAHSTMVIDGGMAALTSSAASKLLRSIDLEKAVARRITTADLRAGIEKGEAALGSGQQLLDNLKRVTVEKERRRQVSRSGLASPPAPHAATEAEMQASAAQVRSNAADAVDEALKSADATEEQKASRRRELTDEPAVIGRARGKGRK